MSYSNIIDNIDYLKQQNPDVYKVTYNPVKDADLLIKLSLIEDKFHSEIISIENLIKDLHQRPAVYNAKLYDLGHDKYILNNPIEVVIEKYEEETIARFPELELFFSSSTESEAIIGLKQEIIDLFVELASSKEKELGLLPKMWRRILKTLIITRR